MKTTYAAEDQELSQKSFDVKGMMDKIMRFEIQAQKVLGLQHYDANLFADLFNMTNASMDPEVIKRAYHMKTRYSKTAS